MSLTSLIKRSATGLIYVALIVSSLMLFEGLAYPFLCMLFCALGILEFHHLYYPSSEEANADGGWLIRIIDVVVGVVMCSFVPSAFIVGRFGGNIMMSVFGCGSTLIILFLIRMIAQLYLPGVNALRSLSCSLMAYVYVGLPLAISTLLYGFFSASIVLVMFVMIWLNDTGAFCVGSMIGRRRLFERISPKKSWEGFWGGMLFCVASAFLVKYCFGPWSTGLPLWQLCVMGFIVSIVATWGDLVESLIKRTVGVKDSGKLLPGHGGILDRIDSLLLTAPAVFVLLSLFFFL